MTDQAIVTHQPGLMPALTINQAVDRYNLVVEFTKAVMEPGKDYGAPFPGTDKPTLLKPGAEKLTSLFGLAPDFVSIDKIVDFEVGMFYFQYQCDLYKDGIKVGSGIGSCNSRETKYRYRWLNTTLKPDKEEGERLKAEGMGRWRKFNGNWVWQERHINNEPFELVNTIDKMAQKRALVAATLIAANASEFFTQDVEDLVVIEGEFVPEPAAEPIKQEAKPDDSSNGNGNKNDAIYQAVVDAKLSENIHAAKKTLAKCKTGYETPEKAIEWMRAYRGFRDMGGTVAQAAKQANEGNAPK